MRKSINRLSAIVEGSFKLDLFSKSLFVFCNRQRDRIKILVAPGFSILEGMEGAGPTGSKPKKLRVIVVGFACMLSIWRSAA